ncbi:insulinase family protein [Actinoplanes sp. G11-F43]|uniref:insulinase family protein n=1 Tax=Actinoplanes sp. G11-F43 TaxID=3424130 RepID=UPI003D32BE1B
MITRLEVDGVPALLAPADGPMHAGLVFRVGTADETLPRRGLTRLVEHLVTDEPGSTGAEHTYFHTRGTPGEIADYLSTVCAALRNPPADRIAEVRDRIAHTRERDPLPMWRYGARAYGVASYPEWALPGLTDEQVREWIAGYFTRANAALWVAGDTIPDGLRLDLPDGTRRPAPTSVTVLPATPAWFTGPDGAVGWDSVVRRDAAAAVFATVLERRLQDELCDRAAVADRARTEYEPRADGTARVLATVEPTTGRADGALGGLVDVLAALRAGRIDPDEVGAVVKLTGEGLRDAECRGARLPGQAFNLLAGRPVQTLDEALAEVRAVTADDVAGVAAVAYGSGLLMVPGGGGADWAGYTAAPTMSETVLEGRTHRGRGDRNLRLISGARGISVVEGDVVGTVRYDTCAAVLAWPDGARQLIGEDAVMARVEPTLYRDAEQVVRDVDEWIPARLRIDMPPRDRDRIPQPRPATDRVEPAADSRRPLITLIAAGMATLFVVAGGLGVLTMMLTQRPGDTGLLAGLGEYGLVAAASILFGTFAGRIAVDAAVELRRQQAERRAARPD